MIIKLTPAEVKTFVGRYLELAGTPFELEIVAPESALLAAFRTAIGEFPLHATDSKISAIKRFRDLAGRHIDREGYSAFVVRLADAKWAVENADCAISNLEKTGNLRQI